MPAPQEGITLEITGTLSGPALQARQLVAEIEQKALQLSALLRELDNHPTVFEEGLREELEDVLDQLGCRIAATRALERGQASPAGD